MAADDGRGLSPDRREPQLPFLWTELLARERGSPQQRTHSALCSSSDMNDTVKASKNFKNKRHAVILIFILLMIFLFDGMNFMCSLMLKLQFANGLVHIADTVNFPTDIFRFSHFLLLP